MHNNYYSSPPSLGQRLRCLRRHDFTMQYTQWLGRDDTQHYLMPIGDAALVCDRCGLVRGRCQWRGVMTIRFGQERLQAARRVEHLPIAPDHQEPRCGAVPPADMGIPRLPCRKFAYHAYARERVRRVHEGGHPVRRGVLSSSSFSWYDPPQTLGDQVDIIGEEGTGKTVLASPTGRPLAEPQLWNAHWEEPPVL